eukprot:comp21402_c0_seq1/m.29475 comp21402_c0_seq1/g.29475  ORF comp21402_c0_seq1/g.29475 comp21402_c0_seq1/m.29475 type:complete len:167 (-) comp21402_c0_seq1:525-1025(-)
MSKPFNAFSSIVGRIQRLPLPSNINNRLLAWALGSKVKFFGTAKIDVEHMAPNQVSLVIRNRSRVQNHIGGVHAAAMALVAESATGFVVGMNVRDSATPVIKTMTVNFVRRAKGNLRAVAELSEEQIRHIREIEKGEISVPITVTDEDDKEPIKCTMVWAWTPKRS